MMTPADLVSANIRAISPYIPGKPITELAREMGIEAETIVKLASNENPQGMSPKAQAAVSHAISGIARYPDNFELTLKLAAHLGVRPEHIVLGNGSNDVLDLAARVFLSPGYSSVMSAHAFAVYPLATLTTGAQCITAAADKIFGHDLTAMRQAIRPDTRLVWIANPNNPTGTFLPYDTLHAFIADLPPQVMVVLDEAYNEYLEADKRINSVRWLDEFPHLIITRTFSKIYGLAGLRIGYALATPAVADLMNRVRQPFNVNNLALVAAAAALDDTDFVTESAAQNRAGMVQITAGLTQMGLQWIPSQGNFVTFASPQAALLNQSLLQQGVIVRPLVGYDMPQHLRVTIGRQTENTRFLEALSQALATIA